MCQNTNTPPQSVWTSLTKQFQYHLNWHLENPKDVAAPGMLRAQHPSTSWCWHRTSLFGVASGCLDGGFNQRHPWSNVDDGWMKIGTREVNSFELKIVEYVHYVMKRFVNTLNRSINKCIDEANRWLHAHIFNESMNAWTNEYHRLIAG